MHSRTVRMPTEGEQKSYWDTRWNQGKDTYPNAWARRRGAVILSLLQKLPLRQPRILDMGCGTGWFTKELAELGDAVGVELSEAAIAMAKSQYPGPAFVAGNVLNMPLPPAEFDVVVSLEVIAHVEDQDRYVTRAAEALKPHGYLVMTTVNKFVHDRTEWPDDVPGHIRAWLDRRALRRLVTRHGFRILRLTSVIPMGNGGILRLVNSHRLNAGLSRVLSAATLTQLKERAGLGLTLIALAQKTH
jgi:2-polyprenyl-3-methyl-5-hydroxy-6-metoxy-1,4-benzoquinol methylase